MRYRYTAVSDSGKTVKGSINADSLAAFYAELESGGMHCIKVREEDGARPEFSGFGSRLLPLAEKAVLCRQLASMTASGVTVDRCLDVLYGQCETPRTKTILSRLYREVQKGNQLSSAMRAISDAFEPFIVNMVEAGENSGTLDRSLARLADHFEREIKLRNKITLALLYPAILAAVSFVVIIILFVVVLPSFLTMFQSLSRLPWYTRALMAFSGFLTRRWYVVLAMAVPVAVGVYALGRWQAFVRWRDRIALRVPVFGKLRTKIHCARFCRVFSSLYASGMQILDALALSGRVQGNTHIASAIEAASEEIRRGSPLAVALEKQNVFPQMLITMIHVGEESGTLDEMLLKTSDFYDEEADAATQKLIGLTQPVLILLLGIIVAFVMMAVLKPIYMMYENI